MEHLLPSVHGASTCVHSHCTAHLSAHPPVTPPPNTDSVLTISFLFPHSLLTVPLLTSPLLVFPFSLALLLFLLLSLYPILLPLPFHDDSPLTPHPCSSPFPFSTTASSSLSFLLPSRFSCDRLLSPLVSRGERQ